MFIAEQYECETSEEYYRYFTLANAKQYGFNKAVDILIVSFNL